MTRTSPHFPVRRTAQPLEERRMRITGMVRAGHSHEAVAREETLSRERIRQIVTQSLHAEDASTRIDQNRLQLARLEPALRLAARGVENGKLQAIVPLPKVLERLDKYGAVVGMAASETDCMHGRLMEKINDVGSRTGIPHASAAAADTDEQSPEAESGAAAGDLGERKNLDEAKMGRTDL